MNPAELHLNAAASVQLLGATASERVNKNETLTVRI
jgi:hypothetical protein